jgi:hypothetical protein
MPSLLPLVLSVAVLASPQATKAKPKPPTEGETRAAIKRLLSDIEKAPAKDMGTVVRFARDSDKCLINIVSGLVPTADPKVPEHRLLIAYHLAGAVRYDLDHPKLMKDELADKEAAVRASFVAYKFLQGRKKGYTDPTMEKLVAADKKGTLKTYIKSVIAAAKKK